MAYFLHHTATFINPLNEVVRIELYKKDVEPEEVIPLRATYFRVSYPKGEGKKFDAIIGSQAELGLWLEPGNALGFDDFIVTYPDEWKVVAYVDDQIVFTGFLTPGEGRSEFQDKPYEIHLSATDGLGLLKGIPLTDKNGEKFEGVNLLIDYIAAILSKTGLDLNIRVYSNIVEESMEDRSENEQADTFNQTALHARTFLKDSIEFCDCYKALEIILSEYFSLYQWNGRWVILRIGEMQENAGAKIWWTEYGSSGTVVDAQQSQENACAIGRDRLIHPIELSQAISSDYAVKSTKYTYNYVPWPELPTNNKFEYGTFINEGVQTDEDDVDGDGNTSEVIGTYKQYTIDNWEFGKLDPIPSNFPFPLSTPEGTARVKRIYNEFGTEIDRQIILDAPSSNFHWLRSEPIPVSAGDKIEFSLQKKFRIDFTGSGPSFTIAAIIYVVNEAGTEFWGLSTASPEAAIPEGLWKKGSLSQLVILYAEDQNSTKYASLNVASMAIPVNGNLFIALSVSSTGGPEHIYRDISLKYTPYIAGGYVQVKGDYSQTEQASNLKDKTEVEVSISDSLKKLLKGALYRQNLTSLTTPTWHRYGVSEQRHFKELGELARFNHSYRRMWKIDGRFAGTKFTPADDSTLVEPLSFHRHFLFPDSPKLIDRYFMLVPPLTINYSEGEINANFSECFQEGSGDGNQSGNIHTPIKFIFD